MPENITYYTSNDCQDIKYNILMVDDSKTFNMKITHALSSLGHEVTQSYTLKDTELFLDENKYDFILLDLILPDGESDELIDQMSAKEKSKVIVLSGDNDMQRRSHIFNSGILDYFSKSNPTPLLIEDIKTLFCNVQKNSSINILIVDDSSFMRKLLKATLTPKRYNILEARDGQEGMEILEKNEVHLMLLDLEMPGISGAEMLEAIKAKSKFIELPVIILSSNDSKDIVARVLKHGARDFIKKPFVTEELLLKCDLHVKDFKNIQYIKQKEIEIQELFKKAKKAEEHKSLFLANMSHEIRTPLNAILGFVELLKDDEIDKQKLEYLGIINSSGSLLLSIINDILDFSKIESNKLTVNKEPFVIKELFDIIVNLFKPMFLDKGITFKNSLDLDLPNAIDSDFLKLKQIFTNLIGNAIKFTPKGGEISFDILLNKNKKDIDFIIKDTGIGIAKENHKKVFELFTQADDDTTKKFGGTGLGLSISSRLTKLLGGNIGLISELNKGSSFIVTLPLGSQVSIKKRKNEDIQSSIKDTHNKKILVAEDNIANQLFMKVLLQKMGFGFDIVSDGVEAIESFKKNRYDIVLMDENMPNMCGTEAVKYILEYEKENNLSHTPIVSLTANAIKADRERFINAGMDEYLTKPINKSKLNNIFNRFLNSKKDLNIIYPKFFLVSTAKAISHIEDLIDKQEYSSISKYLTIIKSTSNYFEFKNIYDICISIEDLIKNNSFDLIKKEIEKLGSLINE